MLVMTKRAPSTHSAAVAHARIKQHHHRVIAEVGRLLERVRAAM